MRFQLRIDAPRFSSVVLLPLRRRVVIGRWPHDFPDDGILYYSLLPASQFFDRGIDYLRTNAHAADSFLFIDKQALDASRQHIFVECTERACWVTDISRYGALLRRRGAPARERLDRNKRTRLAMRDQIIIPTQLAENKDAILQEITFIVEEQARERLPSDGEAPLAPAVERDGDDIDAMLQLRLGRHSRRLIHYLPEIYHPTRAFARNGAASDDPAHDTGDNFMVRFLALFETILFPIEWQIAHFDLFLSPATAPASFLPWLAHWFTAPFDVTWSDAQRRQFLVEAHELYARRGTPWSLRRMLEIYLGPEAQIQITSQDLPPHSFRITLRAPRPQQEYIRVLIDANKPAHTRCEVIFVEATASEAG